MSEDSLLPYKYKIEEILSFEFENQWSSIFMIHTVTISITINSPTSFVSFRCQSISLTTDHVLQAHFDVPMSSIPDRFWKKQLERVDGHMLRWSLPITICEANLGSFVLTNSSRDGWKLYCGVIGGCLQILYSDVIGVIGVILLTGHAQC